MPRSRQNLPPNIRVAPTYWEMFLALLVRLIIHSWSATSALVDVLIQIIAFGYFATRLGYYGFRVTIESVESLDQVVTVYRGPAAIVADTNIDEQVSTTTRPAAPERKRNIVKPVVAVPPPVVAPLPSLTPPRTFERASSKLRQPFRSTAASGFGTTGIFGRTEYGPRNRATHCEGKVPFGITWPHQRAAAEKRRLAAEVTKAQAVVVPVIAVEKVQLETKSLEEINVAQSASMTSSLMARREARRATIFTHRPIVVAADEELESDAEERFPHSPVVFDNDDEEELDDAAFGGVLELFNAMKEQCRIAEEEEKAIIEAGSDSESSYSQEDVSPTKSNEYSSGDSSYVVSPSPSPAKPSQLVGTTRSDDEENEDVVAVEPITSYRSAMCDSIEEATTEEEMAAEIEAREAYERFKANKVIEQREAEQVEVKKTNEIAIVKEVAFTVIDPSRSTRCPTIDEASTEDEMEEEQEEQVVSEIDQFSKCIETVAEVVEAQEEEQEQVESEIPVVAPRRIIAAIPRRMKAIQQIPKIDVQAAKVEEVADREPIVEREVECKVPEIVEVVEKEEERGTIEIQVVSRSVIADIATPMKTTDKITKIQVEAVAGPIEVEEADDDLPLLLNHSHTRSATFYSTSLSNIASSIDSETKFSTIDDFKSFMDSTLLLEMDSPRLAEYPIDTTIIAELSKTDNKKEKKARRKAFVDVAEPSMMVQFNERVASKAERVEAIESKVDAQGTILDGACPMLVIGEAGPRKLRRGRRSSSKNNRSMREGGGKEVRKDGEQSSCAGHIERAHLEPLPSSVDSLRKLGIAQQTHLRTLLLQKRSPITRSASKSTSASSLATVS